MDSDSLNKEDVLKITLANAIKYHGKANFKAVFGKIISKNPNLKNRIVEIKIEINNVIEEVNKLTYEKQKELLKKIYPEFFLIKINWVGK